MKSRPSDLGDEAARTALADEKMVSTVSHLHEQASLADRLRESRSKHLLTSQEDAEKQMRAFRAVLPISSPPFTPNS